MLRALARFCVLAVLAGSFAGTVLTLSRIARDPLLAPMVAATGDQIVAATDRMLAQSATPVSLTQLIDARLSEDPRNWLALDALMDLATERAITLPQGLSERVISARSDDQSLLASLTSCAACAYDAAKCSLSEVMLCQAPVALTPLGDIAGISRAGAAYASGEAVDQIDLALSVVGLGATAAVLVSGSTSAVVKAGAGLARTARKMGRLSPRLIAMADDAVRTGVKWAALPAVRSADDLATLVRADAFQPLVATLADLDRLRAATDATTALHLLPLVDDAADARRLANAAEALGPKLSGRIEVLGKARFLRATVRVSNIGWALMSGLTGLMLSTALLLSGLLQNGLLRLLSARLRRKSR